jgi:hypothetical protein
LAPSERYDANRVRGHKKLTDWERQMIGQVRRWLPGRSLVIQIVSGTALWYHAGQPPLPIRWVLIRDPQGEFKLARAYHSGFPTLPNFLAILSAYLARIF